MSINCTLKQQTALDAKFNAVRMSRSLRNKKSKAEGGHGQYKAYCCKECGAWHVTEHPVVQSQPRHHNDVLIPAIT